jgi:hypothetical protein
MGMDMMGNRNVSLSMIAEIEFCCLPSPMSKSGLIGEEAFTVLKNHALKEIGYKSE